jgi:AcrR family transcriptional regulator
VDETRTRTRGRRPAGEDTRGAILAAARAEFAARGYAGTSVRAIARRADVDPGSVRHWFTDKGELFVASVLPQGVEPAVFVERVVTPGVDGLGERLLAAALRVWDQDGGAPFRAAFSGLTADDAGPRDVAGFLSREVFARVAGALDGPDAALRVSLVASQTVGVLVARHLLRVEPLASLPAADVVALVGPTLQRYLTD